MDSYTSAAVDGHLLTPVTRKPPLRSSADRHGPISKLGDDLLVAILIRLPNARSAFLCKSVCKRWSSLISTSAAVSFITVNRAGSTTAANNLL
ncbi:unnamed protein product [Linum trigynum]|uniref:F-box domain-containing protein n=1 Tax=Linum trigynum TaxID=586398 RepID=A0AAV2GJ84_9ROSI